jgi:hypothetical protein
LRKAIELPKCTKSKHESEDPNRTAPNKLIELPIRWKLRQEITLPHMRLSRNEKAFAGISFP